MSSRVILETIIKKVKKGEESSPFLFMGRNMEILNSEVKNIALELLTNFRVPNVNLLVLSENGEKIKIKEIKDFIKPGELGTPYKFQIFLIENISRMTLQAFNSCLKFFEEPGIQNIIFLTNQSESGVIDTILSRVEIIDLGFQKNIEENSFYFSLLESYIYKKSSEIFTYFYRNKLEKEEYVNFLSNMILFSKKNGVFLDLLEEIDDDILLIDKNNVNAKGVVDKYLMKI